MKWQKNTLMVREDKMIGSTFVLREAGPGDVVACLKAHPKEAAEIIGVTCFEAQANDALAKKCDELTESVDKANARIKELEAALTPQTLSQLQRSVWLQRSARAVLDRFLSGSLKAQHVHDLEKALEAQ